eukprot:26257-Rhodomonas_salina.1
MAMVVRLPYTTDTCHVKAFKTGTGIRRHARMQATELETTDDFALQQTFNNLPALKSKPPVSTTHWLNLFVWCCSNPFLLRLQYDFTSTTKEEEQEQLKGFIPLTLAGDSSRDTHVVVKNNKIEYKGLFDRPVVGVKMPYQFGSEDRTGPPTMCLKGGKLVASTTLAANTSLPVKRDRGEGKIYQESYPDTKPPSKKKQKGGKEVAPVQERSAGSYVCPKTGAWYFLGEDGRRRPVEGHAFHHPVLDRVVWCDTGTGYFLEEDGKVIRENDGTLPEPANTRPGARDVDEEASGFIDGEEEAYFSDEAKPSLSAVFPGEEEAGEGRDHTASYQVLHRKRGGRGKVYLLGGCEQAHDGGNVCRLAVHDARDDGEGEGELEYGFNQDGDDGDISVDGVDIVFKVVPRVLE